MILQSQIFVVILVVKLKQKILSGAVTIDNTGLVAIVDDAVTTAMILDGTILAADIAADVPTTVILTVLAADIAADAVTTAKILDGTILAADIATDAVTTVKIR
jgi:hypothetical protein